MAKTTRKTETKKTEPSEAETTTSETTTETVEPTPEVTITVPNLPYGEPNTWTRPEPQT